MPYDKLGCINFIYDNINFNFSYDELVYYFNNNKYDNKDVLKNIVIENIDKKINNENILLYDIDNNVMFNSIHDILHYNIKNCKIIIKPIICKYH